MDKLEIIGLPKFAITYSGGNLANQAAQVICSCKVFHVLNFDSWAVKILPLSQISRHC
jgi:hypothetical protein